jgi:hypothetical protein
MPAKMATVLGKRARSNSNSTVASSCSQETSTTSKLLETPSKRQRTRSTLGIDNSEANKENIPPLKTEEAASTTPAETVTTSSARAITTTAAAVGPRSKSVYTTFLILFESLLFTLSLPRFSSASPSQIHTRRVDTRYRAWQPAACDSSCDPLEES